MGTSRANLRPRTDGAIHWLLDGDPAIRWQTLRDLVAADKLTIERERRRVACDGWGVVCSPGRIPRAPGLAGDLRTAGSTRLSGSQRHTPCCCSATSDCQSTTRRRDGLAHSFSTTGSSGTAASTTASWGNRGVEARRKNSVNRRWKKCPVTGCSHAWASGCYGRADSN